MYVIPLSKTGLYGHHNYFLLFLQARSTDEITGLYLQNNKNPAFFMMLKQWLGSLLRHPYFVSRVKFLSRFHVLL